MKTVYAAVFSLLPLLFAHEAAAQVQRRDQLFATRLSHISVFRWSGDALFSAVACAPVGGLIAADLKGGSFGVWHPDRDVEPSLVNAHPGLFFVGALAFSPDATLLASGGRDQFNKPTSVKLWDVNTMQEMRSFPCPGNIWTLQFSRDGKRLAAQSSRNRVLVFDVATGKTIADITLVGFVEAIALTPDGGTLITGTAKGAHYWDVDKGELKGELPDVMAPVYSLAVSRDGKWLAAGSGDGSIVVWEMPSRKPYKKLVGQRNAVTDLEFSPDGSRLAVVGDRNPGKNRGATFASKPGELTGEIKIWDFAKGIVAAELNGHSKQVLKIAFSGDGQTLVSGSNDRSLIRWKLKEFEKPSPFGGNRLHAYDITLSRDGHWLVSSHLKHVAVWDARTGAEIKRLDIPDAWRIRLSPDKAMLYALTPEGFCEFKLANAQVGRAWKIGGVFTQQIDVSRSGRYAAVGTNSGNVHVVDLKDGTERPTLGGHRGITRPVFSHNDDTLLVVAGFNPVLRVWNAAKGELTRDIDLKKPVGNFVLASDDKKIYCTGSWPFRAVHACMA